MTTQRTGTRENWLSLASAPAFAVMALLTALWGGAPDTLCAPAHGWSAFGGMAPMYLLMSAVHSAPWLRLISNRQTRTRRSTS
jgi:hypothetical protein